MTVLGNENQSCTLLNNTRGGEMVGGGGGGKKSPVIKRGQFHFISKTFPY